MTQRDVNSLLESSKMNSHIAILQNELAELRKIKEAAEAWSQRQPTCCADDPGAACDRHCASEILAGRGPTP